MKLLLSDLDINVNRNKKIINGFGVQNEDNIDRQWYMDSYIPASEFYGRLWTCE